MSERDSAPNEVRVTVHRPLRAYITYIRRLLEGGPGVDGEEGPVYDEVTIRGMGRAIYIAVNVSEIVKRRVAGLHQVTDISSETVYDAASEDEEGANTQGRERKRSVISIKLSKKPLKKTHPGYQSPLPAELVVPDEEDPRRSSGPPRPRGPPREGPWTDMRAAEVVEAEEGAGDVACVAAVADEDVVTNPGGNKE
eukprot:CAMPEP_0201474750 /NCGR_PEP_ID=MMETSP0151_2-20130828/179_1 /ASSEMBLY_ACC=CAM_ASM_000257 /TAXON_ID=200890 /ORGANISM="Paramoeba atlantica, Strain 621/1 / CCAP 1560/9" /LENGTH=195 /DNA_ID=CAMNT_0047854645 /DNA_START=52 /DNA_END=640 /DNA_ORIENTATION=+